MDGGLSQWSPWSPCYDGCTRIKSRSRTCTNPAPAFGGRKCSGHKSEDQFCTMNCNGKCFLSCYQLGRVSQNDLLQHGVIFPGVMVYIKGQMKPRQLLEFERNKVENRYRPTYLTFKTFTLIFKQLTNATFSFNLLNFILFSNVKQIFSNFNI